MLYSEQDCSHSGGYPSTSIAVLGGSVWVAPGDDGRGGRESCCGGCEKRSLTGDVSRCWRFLAGMMFADDVLSGDGSEVAILAQRLENCKEIWIYLFSEKELSGFSPNFHIHVPHKRSIYSHVRSTYLPAAE